MIYLFHGEEEFTRSEALHARLAVVSDDPAMADLNTTRLDGRKASVSDIQAACEAMPFLADRRLVVVEGLLTRLGGSRSLGGDEEAAPARGKAMAEELVAFLPQVPSTTDLVFNEAKTIRDSHPVVRAMAALGTKQVQVLRFDPKERPAEIQAWLRSRAESRQAAVESEAVNLLAEFVGGNLRLLDQELVKLQTYASGRPITVRDVQLLVPHVDEGDIFAIADAVAQRDSKKALVQLSYVVENGDTHPLQVLALIVRQFRLMIQVKELVEQRHTPARIGETLKQKYFVVTKLLEQVRPLRLPQLVDMYARILETDVAIKTGQMEDKLALELLVVDLCAKS